MGARDQKVERRLLWTTAVGVRARVDLSACLEEGGCDDDRIGRRLLADVLDSIGGHVVQERGVVRPELNVRARGRRCLSSRWIAAMSPLTTASAAASNCGGAGEGGAWGTGRGR